MSVILAINIAMSESSKGSKLPRLSTSEQISINLQPVMEKQYGGAQNSTVATISAWESLGGLGW